MCLAIPGQILAIESQDRTLALVDVLGVRRKVDLALLQEDPPRTGDWVLIHVGFAMSRIDEAQAHDQLRMLESLGESEAALQEAQGYGLAEAAGSPDAGP
jgi:hydrogenase expression/formation protein HypC